MSPLSRTPVAGFPLGAVLLFCAACGGGAAARPISTPQSPPPSEGPPPAVRLDPDARAMPTAPFDHGMPGDPAPPARGIRHVLQPGQTLYAIARAYGVRLEVLMRANGISDPTTVRDGTRLLIPAAGRAIDVPPTFSPSREVTQRRPEEHGASPGDPRTMQASLLAVPGSPMTGRDSSSGALPAPGAMPPSGSMPPSGGSPPSGLPPSGPPLPAPRRSAPPGVRTPPALALAWPLRGMITSRFGLRGRHHHHEGVDIDGTLGEEILAAGPGIVVRSGREGGYGKMVVIDHGGGLTTLYAHASRLLVREGDEVERGEPIAEVGRSGNAHGSHLHFEVHRDGRPIDPLPMLRTRSAIAGDSR